MYKAFQNIPLNVRQQAYDLISADIRNRKEFIGPQPSLWIYLHGDHKSSCPLGVINYLLGLVKKGYERVPRDGYMERQILSDMGIDIDAPSANRFIGRVDRGELSDPKKLASAMGVKAQKWQNITQPGKRG